MGVGRIGGSRRRGNCGQEAIHERRIIFLKK